MVNRDQVAGIAKQMKGSVKQAAGKATAGEPRSEAPPTSSPARCRRPVAT